MFLSIKKTVIDFYDAIFNEISLKHTKLHKVNCDKVKLEKISVKT